MASNCWKKLLHYLHYSSVPPPMWVTLIKNHSFPLMPLICRWVNRGLKRGFVVVVVLFCPRVIHFVGDRTGLGLKFPDLLSVVCFLRQEICSAGRWNGLTDTLSWLWQAEVRSPPTCCPVPELLSQLLQETEAAAPAALLQKSNAAWKWCQLAAKLTNSFFFFKA